MLDMARQKGQLVARHRRQEHNDFAGAEYGEVLQTLREFRGHAT